MPLSMILALAHSWGSCPMTVLNLYRIIIGSKMDDVYIVFNKAAKELYTLQDKCLRLCVGAMRSTTINALLVECGEMPIRIR